MTAGDELTIVLLSMYALVAAWLALDALFGRSRGAAVLRAEGLGTRHLLIMAVSWPFLLLGPWLLEAMMAIVSWSRTIRAVLVVAWEEIFEK